MSNVPAPNLKESLEENKAKQEEIRELHLRKDAGVTIGPDFRNPCKKELDAYEDCMNYRKRNGFIECSAYLQNMKKCHSFWDAVQDYRKNYLGRTVLELPNDDEMEKWQKKMPDWYLYNKLVPPEDLQKFQNS